MSEAAQQPPALNQVLQGQTELRPFPAVASQILAACDDPNAGPRELSHIIQCDPAVALRLLRVANSSMYGFSGEIRTVDHAIVVLGIRTVRSLAVSAATADVFLGETSKAARETLWLHSLACASIAGTLASAVEVAPEEAFLAGMVHDVGKLVFFDVVPDDYAELEDRAGATTIVDMEDSAFGIDHQRIGRRCAEQWGLPGEINAAIGCHHAPERATFSEDLVSVVCLADALTRVWQPSNRRGVEDELANALERANLPIATSQLDELRPQALANLKALQQTCNS